MNTRRSTRYKDKSSAPRGSHYEAAVLPGLEDFALEEIQSLLPGASARRTSREGRLSVRYEGDFERFNRLRSVLSVHAVEHVPAARPSAFLGHENFTALTGLAQTIMSRAPNLFRTLRISAAGSSSNILRRLESELASALNLEATSEPANLELALRRHQDSVGWEVLLRLTPMPLSARAWRICNFPGALHATLAYVMVTLTRPTADDVFVNPCCGSGTLLAERLATAPARATIGFDTSNAALSCAQENLGFLKGTPSGLFTADASSLPLADGSASAFVTDPPFAMLQGTSRANRSLYPAIFREAARVLKPGGTFAIISTQKQLLREVMAAEARYWSQVCELEVKLPFDRGYITPLIEALKRR